MSSFWPRRSPHPLAQPFALPRSYAARPARADLRTVGERHPTVPHSPPCRHQSTQNLVSTSPIWARKTKIAHLRDALRPSSLLRSSHRQAHPLLIPLLGNSGSAFLFAAPLAYRGGAKRCYERVPELPLYGVPGSSRKFGTRGHKKSRVY